MRVESRPVYRFGPFRLDVAEQQLLRDGLPLALTPKVFDVLRVLVQDSGHLVEKERLLAEVWQDSFVEEGALSRSISILRKTLGENGWSRIHQRRFRKGLSIRRCWSRCCDRRIDPVVPAGPTLARQPDRAGVNRGCVHRESGLDTAVPLGSRHPRSAPLYAAPWRGLDEGIAGPPVARPTIAPRAARRQLHLCTGRSRSPARSGRRPSRRMASGSLMCRYESRTRSSSCRNWRAGRPTIFTAPEIGYLRWPLDGTELSCGREAQGEAECTSSRRWVELCGRSPRSIHCLLVAGRLHHRRCELPQREDLVGLTSRECCNELCHFKSVNWSIWDIDWSVNGALTFVSSDYQGRYRLWTVKPDGSEQRRLVDCGYKGNPVRALESRWRRRLLRSPAEPDVFASQDSSRDSARHTQRRSDNAHRRNRNRSIVRALWRRETTRLRACPV